VFRSLLYLLLRTARVHELADIQDDTYRLVADISGLRPELPMGATIFRPGQKAEE